MSRRPFAGAATPPDETLVRGHLKTPKAAAIAGIVFSVLLIVIIGLLRRAVPADPGESGAWLATHANSVALALNLIPFAGVAFLWFIGVLRDRLGAREDRFFATVFFGSGLLFLAMMFTSAAVSGALILTYAADPSATINSSTFHFARAVAYSIMNTYATKMAGVFMASTSTVTIYTGIAPRWIAILGFVLALILLIFSYQLPWSFVVLPAWVLLLSIYILIDNLRRPEPAAMEPELPEP